VPNEKYFHDEATAFASLKKRFEKMMCTNPTWSRADRGMRQRRSVRRQCLGNLLRFAGVGIDFFADDAQCYFMKIGAQSAVKFNELGPQNLIDEALRRADDDGVAPLPRWASTHNVGIERETNGATIGRASKIETRPADLAGRVRSDALGPLQGRLCR
jgi:hypothetical protein